jgi:hypothetical protein
MLPPDDPVLGRPSCAVSGCDWSGWEYGFCGGHSHRWRSRGRPELVGFLADPGPELHWAHRADPLHRARLLIRQQRLRVGMRHRSAWARSGHLDPAVWAADNTVTVVAERGECGLPFCALWPENDRHLFYESHETRWRQLGRPPVDDYLAHCLLRGKARIDFRGLDSHLTLEV